MSGLQDDITVLVYALICICSSDILLCIIFRNLVKLSAQSKFLFGQLHYTRLAYILGGLGLLGEFILNCLITAIVVIIGMCI